jgi:DNA replication protein DnaC
MLTAEIAACCKELKLSRNIVEMAEMVQAESHQEYLLKLLRSELEHRESQRKDKFLKNAGFYSIKTLDGFRFDEVTYPLPSLRITCVIANLSPPRPIW